MNKINNLRSIFHLAIIAVFLLGFSGCGYKADPYYIEETPSGDKNIEFHIRETNDGLKTIDEK